MKEECITQPPLSTTKSVSLGADTLTAKMMFRIQTALIATTPRQTPGHQKVLCHLNSLTTAQFRWCVSHTSLFRHVCDYNAAKYSALYIDWSLTKKAISVSINNTFDD